MVLIIFSTLENSYYGEKPLTANTVLMSHPLQNNKTKNLAEAQTLKCRLRI